MMRTIKSLFMVVVFLSLVSGVGVAKEKEPIVVGSIWDLVGFGGEIGQACYRGAQLAVKLVNKAGGIDGHLVKYTNIDGQSELDVIANSAKRLTEELQVLAAVGSEDDSLTSASGPVFQANKTCFLTGPATTPTQPRIGEYIFMPAYGDHFQGTGAAKFCVKVLGWKKVAVLWDAASAYSTYLSKAFREAFKYYTNDPKSIVAVESYMTGDLVFTAQLTRIKRVQDQLDGFVTFPPEPQDAPVYTKQARKLGITLPLFYTDGADDISLVKVGGDAVEGAHVSTQFAGDFPTTKVGEQFVKDYTAENGMIPGCFEAIGYDSMRLVLESVEAIIGIVGSDMWDSMSLQQKRTAIRNTLQMWPVFTTTTVPISYPPETAVYPRCPDKPVIFKRVKDGKLTYIQHMESKEFAGDLPAVLKAMGEI
jgi:branched-chain amino acid transport system substrate-binding protein